MRGSGTPHSFEMRLWDAEPPPDPLEAAPPLTLSPTCCCRGPAGEERRLPSAGSCRGWGREDWEGAPCRFPRDFPCCPSAALPGAAGLLPHPANPPLCSGSGPCSSLWLWRALALLLLAAVLALGLRGNVTVMAGKCRSCPEDWMWYRNQCYCFDSEIQDWNTSREFCWSHNATLAVIKEKPELNFPGKRGAKMTCAYLDMVAAVPGDCMSLRPWICVKKST
ncbi:C-type lectin domain family 2 member L-like [Alligator mississippiensis]|uniref:C-type lectin domain family 2 member L-like n=1 Tax=Alligator mississippiensis TaxID=8496 RepID=UPI0028778AF6|nr:C-type lectin domain family 2 member L-like [Alligator mississippiensis]XP_059582733.1 C-type lectin domain family 2 member L-like [Alligator mississippiensis]